MGAPVPWPKSQNTKSFWNAARVTTCSVTARKKSLSVVAFLKKKTNKQTKTKPKRNQSTWNDFFDGKKCFTTITREIE